MDRLDGGFSFLIRCPGVLPVVDNAVDFTIQDIITHVYVPPSELANYKEHRKHLTQLMQQFTETVAYHHIHNLQQRATKSNVTLPTRRSTEGGKGTLNIFPTPVEPGKALFLFASEAIGSQTPKTEESYLDSSGPDFWAEACNLDAVIQSTEDIKANILATLVTSSSKCHVGTDTLDLSDGTDNLINTAKTGHRVQ